MESEADQSGDPTSAAAAVARQSMLRMRQGQGREALELAERVHRDLLSAGAPPDELVWSNAHLGWGLLRVGRAAEALARGAEAHALVSESTSAREVRYVFSLMGAASSALGRYDEARNHLEQGLELDRRRGDRRNEASSLVNLGEAARLQGDAARAITLFSEALVLQRELGDRDTEALTLSNLGGACLGAGDPATAVEHLEESIDLFARSGASEHTSETHRFLAEALLALDRIDEALTQLRIALRLAHQDGSPDHLGHAWRVLGLLALHADAPLDVPEAEGRSQDPDACMETSAELFRAAGMECDRALALCDHAQVRAARGDLGTAEALRFEAREVFLGLGLPRLAAAVGSGP